MTLRYERRFKSIMRPLIQTNLAEPRLLLCTDVREYRHVDSIQMCVASWRA
jgi:hypothetical protein